MNQPTPVIETKNLSFRYSHSDQKALDDIDFKAYQGDKIAVLGANGAGKSTLFKHLNGILKPIAGSVYVKGLPIKKDNILDVRHTVGIVFQNPDDQIISPTVKEDVAFGPMNLGLPLEEVEERVKKALEIVNLSGLEKRVPHHLSGGQKKLVSIAGILAIQPEVVILDEPTAGLDPVSADNVLDIIERMNRELNITVIISTHEVDIVPSFAERVVVLHHGEIEAEGTPMEIFGNGILLKKAQLRMPRIAEVFSLLQEEGIEIKIQSTPFEAKEELLKVIKR
ncbi:MAG: cobalt/nickel transport system ATP-binding protein [Methanohalophilus sp. T328-1]|uniref:energy-coupling factor ABC transporter ATP-binding protein n=1 Tax=Methanohalophilus sp. DAL1 TaxID=1864608 RepID=UPI000791D4BE|nr:ATP-binding cassette domain-containing protein [Methanohalophilus sp. DAL1]KXS42511.1 MAG: cobalt/nickel transport system ATP-binding protein [Methanohalophilus sp. T328-1]OBZ34766.1 MAG: ATP-binding protein [Methanohalophilus sp. DAL1]